LADETGIDGINKALQELDGKPKAQPALSRMANAFLYESPNIPDGLVNYRSTRRVIEGRLNVLREPSLFSVKPYGVYGFQSPPFASHFFFPRFIGDLER
jgi:hypothetical protein